MNGRRLAFGLMLTGSLLPGCTAITALEDAAQTLEIYELRPPAIRSARTRADVEVVIEEPIATGALATERIMIRPTALQAQYLPGIRWADPAPVMLQTLLVRTVLDSGAVASVGRRPVGARADFAVLSELTDFHAATAADGAGAVVTVRLIARLVAEDEGRVVATRSFAATAAAEDTGPDSIVAAFDRATAELATEMLSWLAPRLGAAA